MYDMYKVKFISKFTILFLSFFIFFKLIDAFEEGEKMNTIDINNVCNLDLIYNNSYKYSLPKNILEGYLSGKGFDYTQIYTGDEAERLYQDINEIYQNILMEEPLKENLAIMTAGAPGAGKTLKLRQDREANLLKGKKIAYICPDDVCLKSQTRTYKAEIANSDNSKETRQAAYNKWRPGSNAATHLILGNLIKEKYAFYFGTTSTGNATHIFLKFLKDQGYKIRLLHITAPDDIRWESIKERDKTFVQTTETDVREKGNLLPQRINDTFLKYADEIEFYYRDGIKKDAILAATWIRNENTSQSLGNLQIFSQELYENIKNIHNSMAKALNRADLYWESTVEQSSLIL